MKMFLKGLRNQNLCRVFLESVDNSGGHLQPKHWTLRGQSSQERRGNEENGLK